jgi:hypothetical protein
MSDGDARQQILIENLISDYYSMPLPLPYCEYWGEDGWWWKMVVPNLLPRQAIQALNFKACPEVDNSSRICQGGPIDVEKDMYLSLLAIGSKQDARYVWWIHAKSCFQCPGPTPFCRTSGTVGPMRSENVYPALLQILKNCRSRQGALDSLSKLFGAD